MLLDRMRPIVSQKLKDTHNIFLHTCDDPEAYEVGRRKSAPNHRRPSLQACLEEAIELYCDLHCPIETTPLERLSEGGRLALEFIPSHDMAPPIHRDTWLLAFLRSLETVLEDSKFSSKTQEKELDNDSQ